MPSDQELEDPLGRLEDGEGGDEEEQVLNHLTLKTFSQT